MSRFFLHLAAICMIVCILPSTSVSACPAKPDWGGICLKYDEVCSDRGPPCCTPGLFCRKNRKGVTHGRCSKTIYPEWHPLWPGRVTE